MLAWLVPALLLALLVDAVALALTAPDRLFDPFLVLTAFVASRGRKVEAMLAGAVIGLAQDGLGSVVFGIHFLSKVVVAYVVALASSRLIPGQPLTHAVLIAGATVLELVVFAASGFLLGQRFEVRSPGELATLLALNVVLGTVACLSAGSFARRRAFGRAHAARRS